MFLILLPLILIIEGLVFSTFWSWFVVPFGVMDISIAHAIGIQTIITFSLFKGRRSNDEISSEVVFKFLGAKTFVFLCIGYVAHLFM